MNGRNRQIRGSMLLTCLAMLLLPLGVMAQKNSTGVVAGQFKLHGMFSSNMVLQREKPIMVWGWAEAGQKVSVKFGEEKAEATAGADKGRWEVTFPARPANATAQKLTVACGGKTIEMDNIVIGDVWVMNGQSNMALELSKVYESDLEIATSDLPLLREVRVNPNEWETLQEDMPASCLTGWRVSSPKTAGSFSAIGYAFAARLQRVLQIPIGIIDNARGGAAIESLTPRQMFAKDPLAAKYLASVDKRMAEFDPAKLLEQNRQRELEKAQAKGASQDKPSKKATAEGLKSWSVPGRSPNDAAACYNGMFGAFKGLNIKGVLFHQGFNNAMGSSARPKRYRILLKLMIEGWREDFRDAKLPVGVIEFCAGGTTQSTDNFELCDADPASYIREAQRLGVADLKDPEHTEFITGHDEQVPGLHPLKKLVHGARAARWALKAVYGKKIEWDTANLVSAQREGDQMVLTFDKAVMPDDMSLVPEGFSIADKTGKYYLAHASYPFKGEPSFWSSVSKNCEPTKIRVWSPLVKEPVAVRYAWARSPIGNLKVNGKPWQPLQSFRTDTWDRPETDDPLVESVGGSKMKLMEIDAAQRCEFRKAEEARQAVEILKRCSLMGKKATETASDPNEANANQ